VTLGTLSGMVTHYFEGMVFKELDVKTPADYRVVYGGTVNKAPVRHTGLPWLPSINYALARSVYNNHEESDIQATPYVYYDLAGTPLVETVDKDGYSDPAGDTLRMDLNYKVKTQYISEEAMVNMALPFRFSWVAHFLRHKMNQVATSDTSFYSMTSQGRNQLGVFSHKSQLHDGQIYRHYQQGLFWNWQKYRKGLKYPTGIYIGTGISKYWANYWNGTLGSDAEQTACAREGKVCGDAVFSQDKFSPFRFDTELSLAYSHGDMFTISLLNQMGLYSREFPTFGPYALEPYSSLYPMFYRLGLGRMPGYPNNLYYGGRDILNGTSMFWTRLSLDFPYKLRKVIDYSAIPFTSVNQVKLSLIGNVGTTINAGPDSVISALENEVHETLFDVGGRISLTMKMFHRIPVTAYFQVFYPVNQLKAEGILPEDIAYIDFDQNGIIDIDYSPSGQPIGNDYFIGRQLYIDNLKKPRYFMGLSMGIF